MKSEYVVFSQDELICMKDHKAGLDIGDNNRYWRGEMLCREFNRVLKLDDGRYLKPDTTIFSLPSPYSSAPKYANPTYDNAYIKILDLVDKSGEMTLKDCCSQLFGGSNFDTFKTLVIYGFMDCVNPEAKRFGKFKVSDRGYGLLCKAKVTKPAFDLLDFVKKSQSTSALELTMNCTLFGEMQFLEPDFKRNIRTLMNQYNTIKSKIVKSRFLQDFLDMT